MAYRKNPTAIQIGQRIKQARRMAGFDTAAQFLVKMPDWGPSRLGNYEAGISLPSPDDVKVIAEKTGSSPCWIMFGSGPIRAAGRNNQAIRHQNLVATFEQARSQRGQLAPYLRAIGVSRKKLDEHITNPFLTISDRFARRCEQHLKKQRGWMDEQHVETDPVCASFPEDMRRIMIIYSELPAKERVRLLRVIEAFDA